MSFLKSNLKNMPQIEIQFSLIKGLHQMSKQNVRLPAAESRLGRTTRCVSIHRRGAAPLPHYGLAQRQHLKYDAFQMVLSGGTGEKDRTGVSHESFLLMANSQSEMEEWVRAIRRVIWAPLGGGEIQLSF